MKQLPNLERLKASLQKDFADTLKAIDTYLQKAVFSHEISQLNQRQLCQILSNDDGEIKGLLSAYGQGLKTNWRRLYSHRYQVQANDARKAFGRRSDTPTSLLACADKAMAKPLRLSGNTGISLDDLLTKFGADEADRLTRAIRLAHHEGLPNSQLIQMIRGSKARRYQDGILAISTRHAKTLAHTGTAIMASEAKQQFIRDNADIIKGIKVSATLDRRTSPICRHLDGVVMPLDKATYPPYHFNCRSSFEIIYDGYSDLKYRANEFGVVENQTYYEWLRGQDKAYIQSVLGKAKTDIFLADGMTADKFKRLGLDRSFMPMGLDELIIGEIPAKTIGKRIEQLKALLVDIDKGQSMTFRDRLNTGKKWVIADISNEVVSHLNAKTSQVFLSDDTLIKMLIHHPELDLLPLIQNVQTMLLKATAIAMQDDLNILYYIANDKYYKMVVKSTRDKNELYMTTIFKMSQKEFYKDLARQEKKGRQKIK